MGLQTVAPLRSLLFCPANSERKLGHILDFGADAVDLDLEDAVPEKEKVPARRLLDEVLPDILRRAGPNGPKIVVRANGPSSGLMAEDIELAVRDGIFAIHLTKLRSPDDVRWADRVLLERERAIGLTEGQIRLIASVDSAVLAMRLPDLIDSSPRLFTLVLGGVDFAHDIGAAYSPEMTESLWIRSYGVVASRAGGLAPPIHPPALDFNDEAHLETIMGEGRRLGFQGGVAIHPRQVADLNRIFSPSEESVRWAREVVAAFVAATHAGTAALSVNDTFVDYAVARQAEVILHQAQVLPPPPEGEV